MKTNTQHFSYGIIKKGAFTLVEVLITITILSLIFTSVMSVFIYYSTLGAKVEANRLLQSNIKNIIEHITNDIQTNGINMSQYNISGAYSSNINELYIGDNKYYLAKDTALASYLPGVDPSWSSSISDYENDCYPIKEKCVLIKERPGTPPEKIPLSNSWVSFRNMYFHVSDDYIPKVTINFDMGIAVGKGLKEGVIKSNNIQIQTTISEKLLDQNT